MNGLYEQDVFSPRAFRTYLRVLAVLMRQSPRYW